MYHPECISQLYWVDAKYLILLQYRFCKNLGKSETLCHYSRFYCEIETVSESRTSWRLIVAKKRN